MKKVTLLNPKIKTLIGVLVVGILVVAGWKFIWTSINKGYCNSDTDCKFTCGCGCVPKNKICFIRISCKSTICGSACRCENGECKSWADVYNEALKTKNIELCMQIRDQSCQEFCLEKLKKEMVTITTDKTEYEQGEKIKMIIENNLNQSIWYIEQLGEIFDHCFLKLPSKVQKLENGKWKDIELPHKCCDVMCRIAPPIKLKLESKTQKELELKISSSGTYRLKFVYYLSNNTNQPNYVYSNEFTIKKSEEGTSQWKTYTNKEYGFEIKHPSYISPTTTSNDWADGMVDPKENGKLIVNFIACQFSDIPQKEPYHSFTGEIRIRVNPDITDAKDCLNLPFEFPNMKKENVNINGIEFKKFSKIEDAAMGQRLKMEVYRTLHNNACFSIEKVEYGYLFDELERSSSPHFDLESTKKFNSCRKTLEQILSTFRFYSKTEREIDIPFKKEYSIIDKLSLVDEKSVKEYRIGTAKFKIFPKLKNQFGYFEAYNKGKRIYKSEPIYSIDELLAFEYKNNKYIILTEYCGGAHGGWNEYVFILDKNNKLKLIKIFYTGNSPLSEKNLLFKNGRLYLYYLDSRFNYFYSSLADSISFKQYFLIENDNLIISNGDFKKEYLKEASDYEKRLEELYQELSLESKEAQKKVSFEVWFRLLLGKTVNYLLAGEEKKAWEDFDETFNKFSLITASPPKEKNEIKREIIEKMKITK